MKASINITERLHWVDVYRGLAILLMIPANLSPYFGEPHHLLYRFIGSYAAPMFIFLSAGMVMLRAERHTLRYYFKRTGIILLVGILLDTILWTIFPCTSFDVLYIIAIGTLLSFFSQQLKAIELYVASSLIFITSYILQTTMGYNAIVLEVYFNDPFFPDILRLLQSWFIDGWFPMFPWLGFCFFGAAFFKQQFLTQHTTSSSRIFAGGLLLFFFGLIFLFLPISVFTNFASNTIIESREGYSEIFYPPTIGYLCSAVGIVMIIGESLRKVSANVVTRHIAFYGKYSMLVYVLHQIIGAKILAPLLQTFGYEKIQSGYLFLLVNLLIIFMIFLVGKLLDVIKNRYPPKSLFLHVLIGK